MPWVKTTDIENIKLQTKLKLPYIIFYLCKRIIFKYEKEMFLLPNLLNNRRGIAVDIGANRGDYTYFLAHFCKCKKVYAFEPQKNMCIEIESRIKHYKFRNIIVNNVGLSDSIGSLSLNIPIKDDGSLSYGLATFNQITECHKEIVVQVNTLDAYNLKNVIFIKIDVEGYENNLLDGARNTICTYKPILLIEIEQNHLNRLEYPIKVVDVIKKVIGMGYACYYYCGADKNKLRRINISEFTFEDFLVQDRKKLDGSKCTNNFFFIPVK